MSLFLDACGLSSPLALEVRNPASAAGGFAAYQIEQPYVIVGRDADSDLVLQDSQVSRRHAYLQAIGGRVLCIDLHSRTKMRWDGEPGQRERGWLAPGRDVWLGPYALRWAEEGSTANSRPSVPALLPPSAMPNLDPGGVPRAGLALPLREDDDESLWPINTRVALVGRSEACHLVLGHESVSRFHASLIRTAKGVWVVDLLAREGVHVNGQCVRWAWLEDGDAVRFGRFTFVLRYETVPEQISRHDVPLDAGARAKPSGLTRPRLPAPQSLRGGRSLAVRSRGAEHGDSLPRVSASEVLTPTVMEPSSPAQWEVSGDMPPQQVAMWQQQMRMMESFHNDMMLMVQMFMAMHKEHLESVRGELDKVRELSRELGQLQGKLGEPKPRVQRGKTRNGTRTATGSEPTAAFG